MQTRLEKPGPGKILEVAAKLFAERGYSNVSIRDVCRETGTTLPMIYYYFGNKKGLFDAVVRGRISMKNLIVRLEAETSSKKPDSALESFIRVYLSSFPDNAFEPGLYMRDSATLDRQSAKRISEDLDEIHRITKALVEKCVESGIFRQTESGLAADCLLGMLNRVVFQRIHFSKTGDMEKYRKYITGFFFRAMR